MSVFAGGTCTIAARGSRLSLAQTDLVRRALEERLPGLRVKVSVVRTKGDVILDRPLHRIGGKGVFTKELERALVEGEADLCVHSMKDVPVVLAPGCVIGAVLPRADVRDVLVGGAGLSGATTLAEVPAGARIGTGSLRRVAQLRAGFPQIEPKGMRGNVDTRLAKAQGPDYDGAILAAAGVIRLGRAGEIRGFIPADVMVPAAGQGAIGVEVRADDERARAWCGLIDDPATRACVEAERLVQSSLGGSCTVPLGVHASVAGGVVRLNAVVLSPDGSRVARSHLEAPLPASPAGLAGDALEELEAQGAREILELALGQAGER